MKLPAHFDRATVKVNADGLVSVSGQVVGWVALKTSTEFGTEVFHYGFCHRSANTLGPAVDVGYSRDGAAIACAKAWAERRRETGQQEK